MSQITVCVPTYPLKYIWIAVQKSASTKSSKQSKVNIFSEIKNPLSLKKIHL